MKRLGKKYDDRTEYTMEITFVYSSGESENCEVYIPYKTFSRALKDWAYDNFDVTIEGESESDVFNFFKSIGYDLDKLLDDKDFFDYCYSYYEDTPFQEADYEVWKDDFEYDNDLGKYKEFDEDLDIENNLTSHKSREELIKQASRVLNNLPSKKLSDKDLDNWEY